jgi:predicted AAA+ superfamily ATPase
VQREIQNKVLKRIFESKRDEITVNCRELCSEELNDM